MAFVAGRKRVPNPAAGITALVTVLPKFMIEPYKRRLQMQTGMTKDK
jgi:hypothetical protein